MHASALILFAAGASAIPRVFKHPHLHHARDDVVVYTTVVETSTCTDDAASQATNTPGTGNPPAPPSPPLPPLPPPPPPAGGPNGGPGGSSIAADTVTQIPAAASQYTNAPVSSASSASNPGKVIAGADGGSTVAAASTSSTAAAASSSSTAAAASAASSGAGNLPFKNIVIFGDNLSDRGNGSSDHNMAGNPETIYGYKTWTDGPIAAEVLADNMKLPIVYDFAFGHANGGSLFGATVDNTFTQSMAMAPSAADQIQNYTSSGYYNKGTIGQTLHFLWIGNNDVIPWNCTTSFHPFPQWGATNGMNQNFATTLAQKITDQAQTLATAGAKHIFVPNVYNRHVAPVVQRYFSNDTTWISAYGDIITAVNTNLKSNLASLASSTGTKITYYDAFGFLMNTFNAAVASGANGINMMTEGDNICDTSPTDPVPGVSSLLYCAEGHGDQYYWMQYLDPTAHVHSLLATDMQNAIQAAYAS